MNIFGQNDEVITQPFGINDEIITNTNNTEAPKTALQVLKEKGIEGLKQFIQASKNMGAGIVNPPYRVVAHTLQGLEQMMGNPDAHSYKNPITGDVVNPYTSETKITEPIGLALQTAPLVLGLPPTTAGAMFGGGQAMEEGKTPMQVAQNTVIGGILGKGAGMVAGEPLVTGKTGEFVRNRIVPAVQESAEKSYQKVLGATTKTEKAIAGKITPELTERQPFVWTRGGLKTAAERNRISASDELNEAYASLPVKDKVSIKPILDRVNKAQDGLKVNGVLLEQNTTETNILEKLKENLVDMSGKGKASPSTLRAYRQELDSFIAARKKGFAVSDADSAALNARRSMANSIRGELATKYPDIAKLNSEYSLWANMSDLLEKTIEKRPGVLSHIGGVVGNVSGHPAAGVLLRNIGGIVSDNAAWNSFSGSMKARVANLLTKGDIEGANLSLVGAIKEINSKMPKGRTKVPITEGGSQDPFLKDLWENLKSEQM